MATKLYVGGLPYSTTSEDLRALFEQVGAVQSANVITDRMTGKSRGFGFVEMGTEEEAKAAISQLNGKNLDERTITVNEARPQAPRDGGGGFGGGRGFGGGGHRPGGRPRPRW
ncbi:MAG: RNA-binding protein [Nitrospirae bacterium]|nr:RNA-binding protein [Nitrospirota bacterium]